MKIKQIFNRIFQIANTDILVIFQVLKKKISKISLEVIVIWILKLWLVCRTWIITKYFRLRKLLVYMFFFIVIFIIGIVLWKYRLPINEYLIIQNEQLEGHLNISFSSIFSGLGAAILGVLAISFSLSLFAIQQAADKYTPSAVLVILTDKKSLSIFWIIGFISIFLFIFSLAPLNTFIFVEIIATFLFLVIVLVLLRQQYIHIIKIVNPNYQIITQHNKAIKNLSRIDNWLDLMVRIGAIHPGSEEAS